MTTTVTPREARNIRIGLAVFVIVVLLLIFAIPRATPPPVTLADPNHAFVDRAGIVSPEFARQWAGGLLNDDRAQFVIHVDRKAPEGDLASWAIQTATEWKIGMAKDDTGLVLFVFTEPRIARLDVGYGLEPVITDARARQLLEAHLAPAFAAREYERGFDDLIRAIRKELGGEDMASIEARAAAARKRDDVPWSKVASTAVARAPRMFQATTRDYLEGDAEARTVILVFVAVAGGIGLLGVAAFAVTVWRLVQLPAALRTPRSDDPAKSRSQMAFDIGFGFMWALICFAMVAVVFLFADSLVNRQGRFSGAGSMIVWPQPT